MTNMCTSFHPTCIVCHLIPIVTVPVTPGHGYCTPAPVRHSLSRPSSLPSKTKDSPHVFCLWCSAQLELRAKPEFCRKYRRRKQREGKVRYVYCAWNVCANHRRRADGSKGILDTPAKGNRAVGFQPFLRDGKQFLALPPHPCNGRLFAYPFVVE